MPQLNLALVAGEASGDLLGGLLLDGLRAQGLAVQASGIGADQLAARGMRCWWPSQRLAVHGFNWDTLARLAGILALRRQLRARLLAQPPQVFVGVDAPDFNLGLEADLRAAGMPTVHFVCPSVWAWRAQRLSLMARAANHVLCLFPFEPALLARHGIDATYVGHPLAQVLRPTPNPAAARLALGLAADAPVLALLPGSRGSELRYLTRPFLEAAALLRRQWPTLQIVLPAAPGWHATLTSAVANSPLAGTVHVSAGQSHAAMAACDAALVASGTATLETALVGRPMVIAYRMSSLSWALMRGKRLQPWVGLPNILSAEFVVPELLQDQATPAALAAAAAPWLDAAQRQSADWYRLRQRFAALHHSLAVPTGALAAQALRTLLGLAPLPSVAPTTQA